VRLAYAFFFIIYFHVLFPSFGCICGFRVIFLVLFYFLVLLPSFGSICGFHVIFLVLFCFPNLLACNKALSSLTQILSPSDF
jgi:hypothetical protein